MMLRAGALGLTALLVAATPSDAVVIDFESLPAGYVLSSSDFPPGTTLIVNNLNRAHPDKAIIFDSNCTPGNCSGGDDDLRTPGSGVGNDTPQGKMMIIAEDDFDTNPADGLVDDPDDEIRGGTIELRFSDPHKLRSLRVVDFESDEVPSELELELTSGATQTLGFARLGDNSAETVIVPNPQAADVVRIVVGGTGSVDDLDLVRACGDGVLDPGEQCDGSNDAACPGACSANCTCSGGGGVCGDGILDPGEQCDGSNAAACPGACLANCTCPGGGVCGDGILDPGEQCDGSNAANCPGACLANCTCPSGGGVCGDGILDPGEQCDGANAAACPGACLANCTCPSGGVCGNGVLDPGEECDGSNAPTCPGACLTNCTCPTGTVCGDGVIEGLEECDPPIGEICDNNVDDDADMLVDCFDPECEEPVICNMLCSLTDSACKDIKRDPARIKFGNPLDLFKIHGRVEVNRDNALDPAIDGFAIYVSNMLGPVYEGVLVSGDLTARSKTRYRYKDSGAKRGGSDRGGLHTVTVRFRKIRGELFYVFRVKAFADLSAATQALMNTQVYNVEGVASLSAEWKRKRNGWILRESFFK